MGTSLSEVTSVFSLGSSPHWANLGNSVVRNHSGEQPKAWDSSLAGSVRRLTDNLWTMGVSRDQGFTQDQIIASHTCFGGHMDVNC